MCGMYLPIQDTKSIVNPQKYMKPQTFSNVRSTQSKIQQHVCISAISIAVVPMTQINANITFRSTSWAISLSVVQGPNSLHHTVTYPSICASLAMRLLSSIAGIHSSGPENCVNLNSIIATLIRGAFLPHVNVSLNWKFL